MDSPDFPTLVAPERVMLLLAQLPAVERAIALLTTHTQDETVTGALRTDIVERLEALAVEKSEILSELDLAGWLPADGVIF